MKPCQSVSKSHSGDIPGIAFFFLLLAMMVCLFVGVFVGIKGVGELLGTLMWVGVR